MARLLTFENAKTYKTRENAVKAVEAKCGPTQTTGRSPDDLDFFIYTTPEGRYLPVFIGERALQRGVHFQFNVVN